MIKTTAAMEEIPFTLTNGSSIIILLMRLARLILLLEERMASVAHLKSSVKTVCLLPDAGHSNDLRYTVLSNLEW